MAAKRIEKPKSTPITVGEYNGRLMLRGSIYHLVLWIPCEPHWNGKRWQSGSEKSWTLGVGNPVEAKKVATTKIIEVMANVVGGQSIGRNSLSTLRDRFHDYYLVMSGKAEKTLKIQRLALKRGMEFLQEQFGPDPSINKIKGDVFRDYPEWRGAGKKIRKDVVLHEMQHIRQMFNWGMKQRPSLCGSANLPNWGSFKGERKCATRARMTEAQWKTAIAILKTRSESADPGQYNRKVFYWFMLSIAASGMRTGELYQLRNKDVQINDDGSCEIYVRAETCKTREERQLLVGAHTDSGPNPILEWMKIRDPKHSNPEDFVFTSVKGSSIANTYLGLLAEAKPEFEKAGVKHITPYHGRHGFITNRIKDGHQMIDVALSVGTSLIQFGNTYYNMTTLEASKRINMRPAV